MYRKIVDVFAGTVLYTPFLGFLQVAAKCLHERCFVESLGSTRKELMERLPGAEHTLDVMVAKVQARGLFWPLVPKSMPENGNADEQGQWYKGICFP